MKVLPDDIVVATAPQRRLHTSTTSAGACRSSVAGEPATCAVKFGDEAETNGGAGGIRTPDFRLAKAALSQLSYGPLHAASEEEAADGAQSDWWAILDSNQGPQSYQDCALTS